jgi:hypothetical protein
MDLGSDFFSMGMAVKVPDKILAELRRMNSGRPERPVTDPYAANVPLSAYVTEQVIDSFVPGVRQFDEVILWVDPVERRKTRSKALDYEPGVKEALQIGHVTGLLDRLFNPDSLPPAGEVDERAGDVVEPRTIPLRTRAASLGGFNIRAYNRENYLQALGEQ